MLHHSTTADISLLYQRKPERPSSNLIIDASVIFKKSCYVIIKTILNAQFENNVLKFLRLILK